MRVESDSLKEELMMLEVEWSSWGDPRDLRHCMESTPRIRDAAADEVTLLGLLRQDSPGRNQPAWYDISWGGMVKDRLGIDMQLRHQPLHHV